MSTTAITQPAQPVAVPAGACYPPFRMSVDQYEKLVDSGIFTKRDKVQLINGILVAKVTKNPPHSVADQLCRKALERVIPAGWHLRSDSPVRLPPDGEPEPDHCVVRGAERDYSRRHPGPQDVGLLVEIADSSLAADRQLADTYGASRIPVTGSSIWSTARSRSLPTRIPEGMADVRDPGRRGRAVVLVARKSDVRCVRLSPRGRRSPR